MDLPAPDSRGLPSWSSTVSDLLFVAAGVVWLIAADGEVGSREPGSTVWSSPTTLRPCGVSQQRGLPGSAPRLGSCRALNAGRGSTLFRGQAPQFGFHVVAGGGREKIEHRSADSSLTGDYLRGVQNRPRTLCGRGFGRAGGLTTGWHGRPVVSPGGGSVDH